MKKKYYLILLLIILSPNFLYPQNLVTNPSFETHNGVPCDHAVIDNWAFMTMLPGWSRPSNSSSDILTMLTNQSCYCHCFSLDTYSTGGQLPHSGDFMCGLYTYHGNNTQISYREYIQGTLNASLIPGEVYKGSFFVSTSDSSSHATNNIGMHFSTTQEYYSTDDVLDFLEPQVNETSVIQDLQGWTEVTGYFVAEDAFYHFIVGSFFDDASNTLVTTGVINSNPLFNNFSFYYVDDVSVTQKTYHYDTVICNGSNAILNKLSNSGFVGWADGKSPQNIISTANSLVVSPNSPSVYLEYTLTDTLIHKVDVIDLNDFSLGPDTSLCYYDSISIGTEVPISTYLWNTGEVTSNILLDGIGGEYIVEVSNVCGQTQDTILIELIEPIIFDFIDDVYACENDTILLVKPAHLDTHFWHIFGNNNSYDSIIMYNSGLIWLETWNECETIRDSISIYLSPEPSVNIALDSIMCEDQFLIVPTFQGNGDIYWSNDLTDSSIYVSEPGWYIVTIDNNGCISKDSLLLKPCIIEAVSFPNVFTPNNDGVNDVFLPKLNTLENPISIKILNRWGNVVYQSENFDTGWNGSYKGVQCSEGVYYWSVEYVIDEVKYFEQGYVTLIR